MSINMSLPEEEVKRRMRFANNLRYIIRSKNVPRSNIAKAAGVGTSQISEYMRGRCMPSDERISKIADAIGCTVDELFDDTHDPWNFGTED